MPPIKPPVGLFYASVVSHVDPQHLNWHTPVTVMHLHETMAYVFVTMDDWNVQPYPLRDRIQPCRVFAVDITRLALHG